jgi:anti-sigma factor RsiW
MTGQGCIRWQGELAMQSLGKLEPEVAVGLQAHLDGCADCRAEAAELAPLAGALTGASLDAVDDPWADQVPAKLQESVLHRLESEAADERRHTRRRVGALATAGAVAAGIAAVIVLGLSSTSPPPAGRVVALSGTPGTVASITLVPSASGTDVVLYERGQPRDQDFVVTMKSASGTWWQAGSYHTTGATVQAELTCAVPPSAITQVWVRNSSGTTVLNGYVG